MREYMVRLKVKGKNFKSTMARFKDSELVYVEDLGEEEKTVDKIGFKSLDK